MTNGLEVTDWGRDLDGLGARLGHHFLRSEPRRRVVGPNVRKDSMNSLDDDYATPERLAIYLEIGWSDFLFATSSDADSCQSKPYPSPLHDRVPPQFPIAAVALAHDWATNISLDAKSFCDVGGATGRTVYEFERQFPGLEQLVLIEPSKRFCEWAKRLLSSEDDLPDIPT
ncbi:MAG: hypothetical protein ACR2QH_16755, partial [Geminicoccaceae bacterium]